MSASTQEHRGETLVTRKLDERKHRLLIEIRGDVTSTHVPQLSREVTAIIEREDSSLWSSLYMDIRAARMLDCMGLNWIYAEIIRQQTNGKKMVLRISSPAINRIVQFAGIERLAMIKYRRRKQTR